MVRGGFQFFFFCKIYAVEFFFSNFLYSALCESMPIFWTDYAKKVFLPSLRQSLLLYANLFRVKFCTTKQLKIFISKKRKYFCPACGKACSSPSTGVGVLSQSWRCGSLPAKWWSGTESGRTVPRHLWGVGSMGTILHFRSEDLQK